MVPKGCSPSSLGADSDQSACPSHLQDVGASLWEVVSVTHQGPQTPLNCIILLKTPHSSGLDVIFHGDISHVSQPVQNFREGLERNEGVYLLCSFVSCSPHCPIQSLEPAVLTSHVGTAWPADRTRQQECAFSSFTPSPGRHSALPSPASSHPELCRRGLCIPGPLLRCCSSFLLPQSTWWEPGL